MDIASNSTTFAFSLNVPTANKLLSALDESTEWSQCYLMESLMTVYPDDPLEAGLLADRISPRLQHANSGIVLSAVRIIIHLSSFLEKADQISSLVKKCGPPLVTLLHGPPEVQYVALKNIQLILQKHKDFLKSEIKVFFCKYNDPIYVKLAKLEIMFQLADESNIFSLLPELKEYSQEVDVDFVRKAVRSIGRCAVKIESSADKCVETLVDLIETKVDYVVQEAIVVIKDIFRKYPNRFESIIRILCENLSSLDEEEAKSSMIWIIGQYSDRINNADQLLSGFLDGFKDETSMVQLSLLTAIVKLFIKRPALGQTLVPKVLKYSTEEVDNPDLRDRGFMYWRLLSTNPVAAKTIIFGDKPSVNTESDNFDPSLLSRLLYNASTLSSLSQRPTVISQELANRLLKNFTITKKILDDAATENNSKKKVSASSSSSPIPLSPSSAPSPMNYLPPFQGDEKVHGSPAPAVALTSQKMNQISSDLNQLSLLDDLPHNSQRFNNQSNPQSLNNGLPLDLFSSVAAAPISQTMPNRSMSPDLYGMSNYGTVNNGEMNQNVMQQPMLSNNPFLNSQMGASSASPHNPFTVPPQQPIQQQQLYQSITPSSQISASPYSSMTSPQASGAIIKPAVSSNPFVNSAILPQQQQHPAAGQSTTSPVNNVLQLESNANAVIDPFARTSNNKSPSPVGVVSSVSSSTYSLLPVLLTPQLGRGLEVKGACMLIELICFLFIRLWLSYSHCNNSRKEEWKRVFGHAVCQQGQRLFKRLCYSIQ